ncbi:MAG: hypothetical protein JWP78_1841 [Mucilaginibacter sp.]|nr:hypothetical protein [Mucilaginibacter sp.]
MMKKTRYVFLLIAVASLSSCGIFKKDCHCPHFSKIKSGKGPEDVTRYI